MATVQCQQCGDNFEVRPSRIATAKFCKRKCVDNWRKVNFRGEAHPGYKGAWITRICAYCSAEFGCWAASKQRFCSKPCSDKGGFRHHGESHPSYKPDARRRNRRGKHGAWARSVISRDSGTCQQCGSQEQLHAHHIKPFETFPDLRWDLDNGVTLCARCHWAVHSTASNANAVNSGNILPGNAGDNPEPSFGRKPVEGVTTNGRAYRRWSGQCEWCGVFISRKWSDVAGKAHLFCGRKCAGKFKHARRIGMHKAHGGNADTSAARESDDIV